MKAHRLLIVISLCVLFAYHILKYHVQEMKASVKCHSNDTLIFVRTSKKFHKSRLSIINGQLILVVKYS